MMGKSTRILCALDDVLAQLTTIKIQPPQEWLHRRVPSVVKVQHRNYAREQVLQSFFVRYEPNLVASRTKANGAIHFAHRQELPWTFRDTSKCIPLDIVSEAAPAQGQEERLDSGDLLGVAVQAAELGDDIQCVGVP